MSLALFLSRRFRHTSTLHHQCKRYKRLEVPAEEQTKHQHHYHEDSNSAAEAIQVNSSNAKRMPVLLSTTAHSNCCCTTTTSPLLLIPPPSLVPADDAPAAFASSRPPPAKQVPLREFAPLSSWCLQGHPFGLGAARRGKDVHADSPEPPDRSRGCFEWAKRL